MRKKAAAILTVCALAMAEISACGNTGNVAEHQEESTTAQSEKTEVESETEASAETEEVTAAAGNDKIDTNDYFESLNVNEVNITDTKEYTIQLKAKEGWQFDIADYTDVTTWLLNGEGKPAFKDETGVATAVNGENFALDIIIDASKISGFSSNGSGELYVKPVGGNPLVVEGENHGQYTVTAERAGAYTIPKLVVEGEISGTSSSEGIEMQEDTITISLSGLDGVDDKLIDSVSSTVKLKMGDGYYVNQYQFADGFIKDNWIDGKNTYSMKATDFEHGSWSPLGGDGNGNYYLNFGIDGIYYNGLPLTEAVFRTHIHSYGRTFSIESNGSLINDTQPQWLTGTGGGMPILCDAYPDELTMVWPVDFDASALTVSDFDICLKSGYGDELVLQPDTDFTVSTTKDKTTISVNYIYWANIPVYTTMNVAVNTDHLSWDQQKYTVTEITHDYDIASVYSYYIMSGGMKGTQAWTYYGIDGLERWEQAFVIPCYILTDTNENGSVRYYAEDGQGNGRFSENAEDAKQFDSQEDNHCRIEDYTGYFERVYDQTANVKVNGKVYTLDKVYNNADNMPLAPADCTGLTAQPGYVIGDSWEMHGRWPWQTFINTGFQGGTK